MTGSKNAGQVGDAQRAFERARAIYQEQMISEDFTRFNEISSLGHLVDEAQIICKALLPKATSSWEINAKNLAFSLEPFERVLQGVCNLAPMGGDLIWGSISFILETAKGNVDILEEVLGFFMGMTDELEYLRVVEDTFDGSHIVVSAITAVYVAIIDFWVKAVRYYTTQMKDDFLSRTKNWLASSNKMAREFTKLKTKISAEKTRLHEVEATQYHADDRVRWAQHQQHELSKWIDAPHYNQDLRAAEKHRYHGTCEWLRGNQEYRRCMEGQTNVLLVIYGTAGVGKTVLSSWVINEAQHRSAQQLCLYHFFKETDDSKNTALAAMRSLLDQVYDILLSSNHRLVEMFESKVQAISRKVHIDFEPLWEILSTLLSKYSQEGTYAATIVLDAMDECKDSKELVQSLQKLIHDTSSKIRVIVTARPSGDHVDEFRRARAGQSFPIFLHITQDDVKTDISAFITHHVTEIERLDDPRHYDLRNHVIAVLSDVKNHQGMFLWAYLMCKEVECQLQVSGIRKLLERLPKGLDGMYARICQRLSTKDETNREFGRLVLQWIVASRRPMTFAELEEALRTETVNSDSSGKEFFGKDGGLLWSRRDLVRSCGDLVQYTGLAEGDTIGIVHLSARQFFSTHSSQLLHQPPDNTTNAVKPFLVDIRSAELKMGMTCTTYLLSTSSLSNEYLSPPFRWDEARTPGQAAFKQRYPFFDYAALYWSDYILSVIQRQPFLDVDQTQALLSAVTAFTRSQVSMIWLEELLRLTSIEFAQHTLQPLTMLEITPASADILQWSSLLMRALLDFSPTLTVHPQLLPLCISQLQAGVRNGFEIINMGILPLEADNYRRWIRYDPITDNLYSATRFYPLTLKSQAMATGVRLQPVLVSPEKIADGPFFHHSAAVAMSADLIATTYLHRDNRLHSVYSTACWNISGPAGGSSVDNWAILAFSDSITDDRNMFSGNLVAFGKDNTIVTPGGVFDLHTQECINRPSTIYTPDPTSHISDTCFSGQGERVARIRDNKTLEVFDIHGTSICSHEFDGMLDITLDGFSKTGNKAIIRAWEGETPKLLCYLVNEAKRINMSWPSGSWGDLFKTSGVFTRDEGKFVGDISGSHLDWQLVVWTFLKAEGSYCDHADVVHIFKGSRFVFDLAPATSEELGESALVAEVSGSITRCPLNKEWSPPEQEAAWTDWVLTWKSSLPELVVWSMKRNGSVTVQAWLLGPPRPRLISHIEEPVVLMPDGVFCLSPDGSYLATSMAIIEAHASQNSFSACDLLLPGEMRDAAFNMDSALLACLYDDKDQSTLCVFDLSRGPNITQRASFSFGKELTRFRPFFSNGDPNLLAVDGCVMRLEDRHLMIHTQTQIDKNSRRRLTVQTQTGTDVDGFSDCGLYYYDWYRKLYRLPDQLGLETPSSMSTDLRHPGSMKLNSIYVYSPHVLKLGLSGGVVYLEHRRVHQSYFTLAYRSRIICVVPYTFSSAESDNQFTLVWPDNNLESLKLVVVMEGTPLLIDTGVRKSELMKEDEWF